MTFSRLFILVFFIVLAGCHSENDISTTSVQDLTSENKLELNSVFVAKRSGDEDTTEFVLGLNNESSKTCDIKDVGVVDSQNTPISSQLLRMSSYSVQPGLFTFAVIRVNNDSTDSGSSIYINFQVNDSTRYLRVPMIATDQWAANLTSSEDLSKVCLYVRHKSDHEFSFEDVSSCSVNGKEAKITKISSLPEREDNTLLCVMIQPHQSIEHGRTVVAELKLNNGDSFVYAVKAFAPFFVGKTQYDTLLRVVSITETSGQLQLALYNESDYAKSPLVIDAIRIGGKDITASCELPLGPIPPDFHKYQSDVRYLKMPVPWSEGNSQVVEILFHLLKPIYGDPLSDHDQQRRIAFIIKRGLHTVIGHNYDPYLPDSTSIHNGGLRPHISPTEINQRALDIARVANNVPVYARVSSGISASVAAQMGSGCDFMVISPPSSLRSNGKNAISDSFAFYSEFRESGIPFVASINPDVASRFSPDDFRWCALAAMSEGSRGVLVRSTPDSDSEQAWSCLPTVKSIKNQWRNLSSFITLSEKVELSANSNQPGIYIGTLFCGSDYLILFAINEWCTRSSRQGHEPFYAVPRHGVEINLHLGSGWGNVTAENALNRAFIELEQIDAESSRLKLPAFDIGQVIIIRRDTPTAIDAESQTTRKSNQEKPLIQPILIPLDSPFVNLGRQEAKSTQAIKIPIRNLSFDPVTVTVKAVGQRSSNPAKADFSPITIPANSDGFLTGQLWVPLSNEPSITHLRVIPSGLTDSGFDVFIDVEAYDIVQSEPKFVDCGQFTKFDESQFQTIIILSEKPHYYIKSVSAIDVPADIELNSDGKSIRFRAKPKEHGSFAGKLKILIAIDDHEKAVRTLTVPFVGRYASQVAAEPRRLLLLTSQQRQTRNIRLRNINGEPLSIVHAEGVESWLYVRSFITAKTTKPIVEIVILPDDKLPGDSEVKIEYQTAEGAKHSITVPVKVVRRPSSISKNKTIENTENVKDSTQQDLQSTIMPDPNGMISKDTNDKSYLEATIGNGTIDRVAWQVEILLNKARKSDSPQEMQNWMKMHRLLIFGNDAFTNGSEKTQKAFDGVLNPNPPDGPFITRRGKPFGRQHGDRFDQEHHRDQFLHLLSMSGVPLDATLFVDKRQFQIRDLVDNSLREARTTGELAWTVSAYAYYIKPGHQWSNKFGEKISLAILTESLLSKEEGACAGTHQLCAISRVLSTPKLKQDKLLVALWPQLEARVSLEVERLRSHQAADGSFDIPEVLRERLLAQPNATPNRMAVYYMGHCIEWLVIALPPEQLRETWVLRAVEYLATAVAAEYMDAASTIHFRTQEQNYQYGFQTHAISGLARWYDKTAQ